MTTKITIGADPEFGILKEGRLIRPDTLFSASTEVQFGADGCGRIAELRPDYGNTPKELVQNISKLMKKGVADTPALKDLTFKAGSMAAEDALGGHIHFGHSALRIANNYQKLTTALNRTLAVLVMMVEDPDEAQDRRVGTSYGSVTSDADRAQSHGIEYRVLPSWLTHPKEAEAILSTAFIVASEFDSPAIMREAAALPGYDTDYFRECDKLSMMYHLPPIIKFLKKLPLYDEYEEAIHPLFYMIKHREIWSCNKNMIDTWKLKEGAETKQREAQLV